MKCRYGLEIAFIDWSPSMRREWIEIQKSINPRILYNVSLHAEGVD